MRLEGGGQQTRSFCHVDDMVRGLMALALSGAARGMPVNLGNPDERTIREVAELILRLTGSRSPLVEVAPAANDPRRRCPNITRARTLLGWEPVVGLEEGLKSMIAASRAVDRDAAPAGAAPVPS